MLSYVLITYQKLIFSLLFHRSGDNAISLLCMMPAGPRNKMTDQAG